jgi:hypothetical protein
VTSSLPADATRAESTTYIGTPHANVRVSGKPQVNKGPLQPPLVGRPRTYLDLLRLYQH